MKATCCDIAGLLIIEPKVFGDARGFFMELSDDLAASGFTSWHGFASRIVELMPEAERRCREVAAISTAEYPTPAKRPAYSVLDCSKLKKTFSIQLPDWEECLRLVLGKP